MFTRSFVAGMTVLTLLATLSPPVPAAQIDIIDLHKNTSSVVPNKSFSRFSVTGVVTSPDGVRSSFHTDVSVQDSTGGMTLFHFGGLGGASFNLGDSITVEGRLWHFNGLAQLDSLSGFVKHSTSNPVPEPLLLTCDDVNNTLFISLPDSFPEANESRLIRINNVSVISGSWPSICTGSNSILTIQDVTGTTTLFIDHDTEICGSPDPSGPFDVIGILTQFDSSAPHSEGYEIAPRYISDIMPLIPGPIFVSGPVAVNIDSISATIEWETDVTSTSRVEYGLSVAYGSAEGDSTPVINHSVPLTGLTPGKVYNYMVSSTNVDGTRGSANFTFLTPTNLPGAMNFYFSHSIDAALASSEAANGNVDLKQPIFNRITAAQHDISVAIYSFNLSSIADSLIAAWNRGVLVRVILDAGVSQTQANRLVSAGIPVITSTYGGNHAGGGIHHNKFFIFDTRDTTSQSDDWVWTGSVNMTSQNMQDANNGVEIQNTNLTQAFLIEFNEQWGSDTDTPNSALSRMGDRKLDNTPHNFTINGIPIELYFSPSDGTENEIVTEVNDADHTAFFAQSVFTSNPIENALRAKHNGDPGFAVRGVFDAGNSGTLGSAYPPMSATGGASWSPPADVWMDGEGFALHHKYGIIDNGYGMLDPVVITGSHNWSNAANTVNDENTLIFHDLTIANLFIQEWAERYHNAGGSGEIIPTVSAGDIRLPNGIRLSSPWPNPVRGRIGTVDFALPETIAPGQRMTLKLFDTRGRLSRTFVDGPAEGGPHRIEFDGRDNKGRRLPAGIYFLRFDALGSSLSQKWVVLE